MHGLWFMGPNGLVTNERRIPLPPAPLPPLPQISYTLAVHDPEPHAWHWGLTVFSTEWPISTPIQGCFPLTNKIHRLTKDLGWQPLHSLGSHMWSDECKGLHRFEFWALDGNDNHRSKIEDFIFHFELPIT